MSHRDDYEWANGVNSEDAALALAIQESLLISSQRPSTQNGSSTPAQPTPPAPKPVTEPPEPLEETVWANIERYLRTRNGPKPLVTCAICQNELVVPGLQENDGEREAMRKLPCGHVLGSDCTDRWIETRLNDHSLDDNVAKCPFCRAPIMADVNPGQRRRAGDGVFRPVVRGGSGSGGANTVTRGIYFDGRQAVANFEPRGLTLSGALMGLGRPRNRQTESRGRRSIRTSGNRNGSGRPSRRPTLPVGQPTRTNVSNGARVVEARHPDESQYRPGERSPQYFPSQALASNGAWIVNALHPDDRDSHYLPPGPYYPARRLSSALGPRFSGGPAVDARHPDERDPYSSPSPSQYHPRFLDNAYGSGSQSFDARHPSEYQYRQHQPAPSLYDNPPQTSYPSGYSSGPQIIDAHHPSHIGYGQQESYQTYSHSPPPGYGYGSASSDHPCVVTARHPDEVSPSPPGSPDSRFCDRYRR